MEMLGGLGQAGSGFGGAQLRQDINVDLLLRRFLERPSQVADGAFRHTPRARLPSGRAQLLDGPRIAARVAEQQVRRDPFWSGTFAV